MTDRSKFEQMLEYLVNEDQTKAKELFHQIVVEKSREIYENLLAEEMEEDDVEEAREEEEEGMEEARAEEEEGMEEGMEEEEEEGQEEGFDLSMEAGEEEEEEGIPPMDMTADLEADTMDGDTQDNMGKLPDEIASSIDDLIADLAAAFDGEADAGKDDEMDAMPDDEEDKPEEAFQFEDEQLMREYVEKVGEAYKGGKAAGTTEASGANTKSTVASKNDMGGTTENIARGGEGGGKAHGLPGHSSAKVENFGNINVPGGKAGSAFKKSQPGHGAEKKGTAEKADNKMSPISGLKSRAK